MAEELEDLPQPQGPRAFWSGTITFGLVSVPVDLYPAVRSHRVPLRMLGPEGQPLARRYFCSGDGEPLTYDDIVRGYETEEGSYIVVEDEELDALAPRKSRDIDLRRFVGRDEIPPALLERPYLLAPAGDSTKAYHLLAATMERTKRAGIATFVMRGKEYLAAIFAEGGLLRAVTMRFVDELRSPADVGLPRVRRAAADTRKEIDRAIAALEQKDVALDELRDEYSAALLELAERKRGASRDVVEVDEVPAADEEESAEIIDIMSVLRERMGGEARGPARAEPARARSHGADGRGNGKARGPKRAGADDLERKSKKELYDEAKRRGVPNRSQMTKEELVAAIRKAS